MIHDTRPFHYSDMKRAINTVDHFCIYSPDFFNSSGELIMKYEIDIFPDLNVGEIEVSYNLSQGHMRICFVSNPEKVIFSGDVLLSTNKDNLSYGQTVHDSDQLESFIRGCLREYYNNLMSYL